MFKTREEIAVTKKFSTYECYQLIFISLSNKLLQKIYQTNLDINTIIISLVIFYEQKRIKYVAIFYFLETF